MFLYRRSLLIAVVLGSLSLAAPAHAADITWTNAAGGNWNVAANWNSGAGPVPGPLDRALITTAGTYTVTLNVNAAVAGLVLGAGTGTQTLTMTTRTLTLDGASSVGATGVLNATSASTVAGAGPLTNQGVMNVTVSTIQAPLVNEATVVWRGTCVQSGALTASAGSTLRMQGDPTWGVGQLTVANGFTNDGTIQMVGGSGLGAILNVTAGTLVNAAGRTIDVQSAGAGTRSIGAVLNNHGTLTVGTALIISKASADHVNQSDGTIDVGGGNLTFTQSGTTPSLVNQGAITVAGGRALQISGGVFSHMAGTLTGAGALTLTGVTANVDVAQGLAAISMASTTASFVPDQSATAFTLTNSTLIGPGTLTNPAGRTTNLTGSTIFTALINQGTLVWRGTSFQNGTLTAAAGSTLRMQGDNVLGAGNLTVASGFNNDGTIEMAGGSGFGTRLDVTAGTLVNAAGRTIDVQSAGAGPRTIGAALDNHGTLTVNFTLAIIKASADHVNESDGTINLSGGDLTVFQGGTTPSFVNQGVVTIGPERTWTVTGGGAFSHVAGTMTGAGTLALTGVTANVDVAQELGAIALSSTTASFVPDQSATAFTIGTSTFNGPGTLTNPAGRTINIVGSTINTPLINQGTVAWGGSSAQNGALTASAGSTLRIQGGTGLGQLTVANGFTNEGTIELAGNLGFGATLNVTTGTLVNAAGRTIDVQSVGGAPRTIGAVLDNHGTLMVNSALVITKASADHVNRSDGTINVSGGNLTVTQSGTTPSFVNQGAVTIAPGRTWTVTGGSFDHVAGTMTGGAGTLALTGATANVDVVQGLGAITLSSTTASFVPNQGLTAFTLTTSTFNGPGTLTNPAGRTTNVTGSTINTALINQGTVVWRGSSAQNGALTAVAGSTLRIEGDAVSLLGQLTVANGFTNDGTIEMAGGAGLGATLNVTAGVLVNAAGRTIDVQSVGAGPRTIAAVLDNHGTLMVGTALVITKPGADHVNESDGTIHIGGGNLTLTQSGTTPSFVNQGTVTIAPGRTWTVTGGAFSHVAGTMTGAATLALTGVTANVDVVQGLGAITLTNTTASFVPDQGATAFTATTSTFNGPGTLTNPAGRTTNVTGSTINTPLINQGTVVWRGSNAQNGALTAAAGSTLRMEGDAVSLLGQLTVANGFTNDGTIELAGGSGLGATLNVTAGTLVNAAGRTIDVQSVGAGSRTIAAALDNHGTLTVGTALVITKPDADHVNESDGTIDVSGGNLTLTQSGTTPSFVNQGAVTMAPGRTWTVTGGAFSHVAGTMTGAATLALTGVTANVDVVQELGAITLTTSTASFVPDQGPTAFTMTTSTFNGPGTLTNPAGRTTNVTGSTINTALINQGTVVWRGSCAQNGALTAVAGSTLRMEGDGVSGLGQLTVASGFTNDGTIELAGGSGFGATLNVTAGTLVNAAGRTIDVQSIGAGPRTIAAVLDNHGTLTVGTALIITKPDADHVNESDGTINVSGGNLTLTQSGTTPSFVNQGAATVAATRTWTATGGTFELASSGVFAGAGTLNVAATSFAGNAGRIVPGASAGTLTIIGPYPESPTAVVDVEIGGLAPGSQYDRLAASGPASVSGTMNLALINGFTPVPGDQFRVFTAASLTGHWIINGGEIGGGIALEPRYDATGLTLVTVGQTWSRLNPPGSPPAREGHGAVYDPGNNRMTVFGGRGDLGLLADTWALTNANGLGGAPAWSLLATGPGPAPRAGHAIAYDPATNRMIVHGGDDGTSAFGDVWILTNANGLGGAAVWTPLAPSGGPPAGRTRHSVVYDAASNRLIVFGGVASPAGCAGMSDVWVLTNANGLGGTPAWSPLAPSGGPTARWSHGATYDPASNRMTIFGGEVSCSVSNDEVWVLSGANGLAGTPTWAPSLPAGAPPAPWSRHRTAYDPTLNRLTAFGGLVNGAPSDTVWTLTQANGLPGSGTWLNLTPGKNQPPGRSFHSAVQDAANHRMMTFAGLSASGRLNDTWVLEETAGRVLDVPPPVTPPTTAAAPAFTGFGRDPAPNPSRGAMRFSIVASHRQSIDVTVYDLAGRRVAVLHRGALEPGEHDMSWDGGTLAGRGAGAGVYLLRLNGEGVTETRRICLLR